MPCGKGLWLVASYIFRAQLRTELGVEAQRLWNECLREREGESGFRTTGLAQDPQDPPHDLMLTTSLTEQESPKGREISVKDILRRQMTRKKVYY